MAEILLQPRTLYGDTAISHKAANACLKNWRSWMSTPEGQVLHWSWDLTHESFDWKRYLSHHPQSEELIGNGVVEFQIQFLNSWDHNMKQPRCDFVVRRADGTAARLHPSSTGPGQIVIGCLDDWVPHGNNNPVLLERDTPGVAEHGHRSDDEEADFEPVYLTTEVSPEELFRLVKEAQRVEERALAAIAKRKACQVSGPKAEVGLVPTAAAGSAAAAAGSRASGAPQATTLAPL